MNCLNGNVNFAGKTFESAWRFGEIIRKCPCQLNCRNI